MADKRTLMRKVRGRTTLSGALTVLVAGYFAWCAWYYVAPPELVEVAGYRVGVVEGDRGEEWFRPTGTAYPGQPMAIEATGVWRNPDFRHWQYDLRRYLIGKCYAGQVARVASLSVPLGKSVFFVQIPEEAQPGNCGYYPCSYWSQPYNLLHKFYPVKACQRPVWFRMESVD